MNELALDSTPDTTFPISGLASLPAVQAGVGICPYCNKRPLHHIRNIKKARTCGDSDCMRKHGRVTSDLCYKIRQEKGRKNCIYCGTKLFRCHKVCYGQECRKRYRVEVILPTFRAHAAKRGRTSNSIALRKEWTNSGKRRDEERLRYKLDPVFRSNKLSRRSARRCVMRKTSKEEHKRIAVWMASWQSRRFTTCYWCGEATPVKQARTDHVIPLVKGGLHKLDNLCVSCFLCNARKSARSIKDWASSLASPLLAI